MISKKLEIFCLGFLFITIGLSLNILSVNSQLLDLSTSEESSPLLEGHKNVSAMLAKNFTHLGGSELSLDSSDLESSMITSPLLKKESELDDSYPEISPISNFNSEKRDDLASEASLSDSPLIESPKPELSTIEESKSNSPLIEESKSDSPLIDESKDDSPLINQKLNEESESLEESPDYREKTSKFDKENSRFSSLIEESGLYPEITKADLSINDYSRGIHKNDSINYPNIPINSRYESSFQDMQELNRDADYTVDDALLLLKKQREIQDIAKNRGSIELSRYYDNSTPKRIRDSRIGLYPKNNSFNDNLVNKPVSIYEKESRTHDLDSDSEDEIGFDLKELSSPISEKDVSEGIASNENTISRSLKAEEKMLPEEKSTIESEMLKSPASEISSSPISEHSNFEAKNLSSPFPEDSPSEGFNETLSKFSEKMDHSTSRFEESDKTLASISEKSPFQIAEPEGSDQIIPPSFSEKSDSHASQIELSDQISPPFSEKSGSHVSEIERSNQMLPSLRETSGSNVSKKMSSFIEKTRELNPETLESNFRKSPSSEESHVLDLSVSEDSETMQSPKLEEPGSLTERSFDENETNAEMYNQRNKEDSFESSKESEFSNQNEELLNELPKSQIDQNIGGLSKMISTQVGSDSEASNSEYLNFNEKSLGEKQMYEKEDLEQGSGDVFSDLKESDLEKSPLQSPLLSNVVFKRHLYAPENVPKSETEIMSNQLRGILLPATEMFQNSIGCVTSCTYPRFIVQCDRVLKSISKIESKSIQLSNIIKKAREITIKEVSDYFKFHQTDVKRRALLFVQKYLKSVRTLLFKIHSAKKTVLFALKIRTLLQLLPSKNNDEYTQEELQDVNSRIELAAKEYSSTRTLLGSRTLRFGLMKYLGLSEFDSGVEPIKKILQTELEIFQSKMPVFQKFVSKHKTLSHQLYDLMNKAGYPVEKKLFMIDRKGLTKDQQKLYKKKLIENNKQFKSRMSKDEYKKFKKADKEKWKNFILQANKKK